MVWSDSSLVFAPAIFSPCSAITMKSCLYPDYCISIGVTGTPICVAFSNASGVDQDQVDWPLLDGVGCDRSRAGDEGAVDQLSDEVLGAARRFS